MPPPEVIMTVGDEQLPLNEDNCWVCIFVEAPEYDHIYIYEPSTLVVFNNRAICDQLMQLGYPMQIRRLPRPWDVNAYDLYIAKLTDELDHDLEEAEELDEPRSD